MCEDPQYGEIRPGSLQVTDVVHDRGQLVGEMKDGTCRPGLVEVPDPPLHLLQECVRILQDLQVGDTGGHVFSPSRRISVYQGAGQLSGRCSES